MAVLLFYFSSTHKARVSSLKVCRKTAMNLKELSQFTGSVSTQLPQAPESESDPIRIFTQD